MNTIVRRLAGVPVLDSAEAGSGPDPEWLVTNGLGGYASGTVSGLMTRRYHGLLVAALPAPIGRFLMLSGLDEEIRESDGRVTRVSPRFEPTARPAAFATLVDFRLELGLPVWRYEINGWLLEKSLHLPYLQNTVQIRYNFFSCPAGTTLKLRPLIQFRRHDADVSEHPSEPYVLTVFDDRYEIAAGGLPTLRMLLYDRGEFLIERKKIEQVRYIREALRGYPSIGNLWTPGAFVAVCFAAGAITLVASAESREVTRAMHPAEALAVERYRRKRRIESAHPKARSGFPAELVLAADQFIAPPAGRLVDRTLSQAAGDEMRTIIAGYHWFTDWGRDAMISLEGLTLTTCRFLEAGWILRNFARTLRHGLIPNLFPEGSREGLYHTADATLWFFHAIDRYLQTTGDRSTLRWLPPRLGEIVERRLEGTRFGIGVDPDDGLLRQGQEGYPLTWMDAKVGDWVVTPRRGKAVEINALWYNALRLLQGWLAEENEHDRSRELCRRADRVFESFNKRFWYAAEGYLYDVIDGPNGHDAACRPNQLLAISLPHAVLDPANWKAVLETVRRRLLTPFGLRSLSRDHPEYKSKYFGDARARRRLSPGNRVGVADRAAGRCLASSVSWRQRRSASAARGFCPPSRCP